MKESTTVDFVARGESPEQWQMVLVEEGPWVSPIEDELRRVQGRLYGCIDAALDGLLAEKFPESCGKDIVVRLDCYNVSEKDVSDFFDRFSRGVFLGSDYKSALEQSEFVRSIAFVVNFDTGR